MSAKDWEKDGAQRQPVTSEIELTLFITPITTALQNLQFTELTGSISLLLVYSISMVYGLVQLLSVVVAFEGGLLAAFMAEA